MYIFRLEKVDCKSYSNKNINTGVYQSGIGSSLVIHNPSLWESEHPTPSIDPKLCVIWEKLQAKCECNKYFFGFHDLKSLYSWFNATERLQDALNKRIIRIGVYHVADECYHRGTRQSIALGSEMELIEVLSDYGEISAYNNDI